MAYKQHSTDTDQIGALKEYPRSRPTDDTKNKFIVQVSATNSKKKLQDSLDKIDISKYSNHRFKFISKVILL